MALEIQYGGKWVMENGDQSKLWETESLVHKT